MNIINGEGIRAAFSEDVSSLVSRIEDFDNPFEEESADLLVLNSNEIVLDEAVVDRNAKTIGQKQFEGLGPGLLYSKFYLRIMLLSNAQKSSLLCSILFFQYHNYA